MKGYIYTLEATIAISMILVSMAFLFGSAPTQPELEISIIKQQSFEALEYLDQLGLLREAVHTANETYIENQLSSMLPGSIQLEAEICTTNCSEANVPEDETTIALDYYITGYKNTYLGKRVRLWLWREY